MKAVWNGEVIAESSDTIVVEGNHYFPANSVKKEFLKESNTHTTCPWKGEASYYSVTANGKTATDAAWYYPTLKEGAPEQVGQDFSGYIAFWMGVEVTE